MELSELARNRAEEYGKDLWTEFVIPPYYSKLELLQSKKPSVIEGGRGSGKTMLLRYLCHDTQFSKNRKNIIEENLNRVGIYWKMDTQFAKIMDKRGETSDVWMHAFINMGVLILSREILGSIANIQNSTLINKNYSILNLLDFSALKSFDKNIPSDFYSIRNFFHSRYNQFQVWVSNYKKIEQPLFYPLDFVKDLIDLIKIQIPLLENTTYHVYIDEYENLLDQQKRIINTWLKHSQSPLIFNIAMKHNAFNMRETLGEEKIVAIHDYRMFDIEDLLDNNFKTFACEILLLKLKKSGFDNIPIEENKLFDASNSAIESRKLDKYKSDIETKIKELFPGYTNKELATIMLEDSVIKTKIDELIKHALKMKGSEIDINIYFDEDYPEVMIILPALLSRNTLTVNEVISELLIYKTGNNSEFKNWISNNLVGCILHIYGKLNRICPFYAGYEAFVTMSKDNIRHFLELCYTSLAQVDTLNPITSIPQKQQAAAVKQVSANMLKEIKSLGIQGNTLYTFALRLGTVFEEGRKKVVQSEPEQTQFNIKDSPSEKSLTIIDELVKWSVLYESKLTKQKNIESGVEYQLNPIYSAYFTISYRKKRRISLTNNDFEVIAFGDSKDFESFLKNKYSKTQDNYIQNSLFDDDL
jgi:hypothetical protein